MLKKLGTKIIVVLYIYIYISRTLLLQFKLTVFYYQTLADVNYLTLVDGKNLEELYLNNGLIRLASD